jgi:hypothetical protein
MAWNKNEEKEWLKEYGIACLLKHQELRKKQRHTIEG